MIDGEYSVNWMADFSRSYVPDFLAPFVLALFLAFLLGRPAIPFLHGLHVDQTEKEEGLSSHKKKNGTPTMGGIIFLVPYVAITAVYAIVLGGDDAKALIAILIPTLGCGIIGFLDDFLKVRRHHNNGLMAWQKLMLQLLVTLFFAAYVYYVTPFSLSFMLVPFTGTSVILGVFSVPALVFIALAISNGTNLTDGVDGLCASVTVPVAIFFGIYALLYDSYGCIAGGAMAGALLGYLFYNYHPAKVFMGDTGSLALGGFILGISYVQGLPLLIPIAGLIYAVEALSVVLQVGYFKISHGKRIFRMAPIHHHFEKGGWSETKVVGVFTTVTIVMCFVAFAAV